MINAFSAGNFFVSMKPEKHFAPKEGSLTAPQTLQIT